MSWGSAGDFFAMGGYAFYVWGAYGVSFALLAAEVLLLARRGRTSARRMGRNVEPSGPEDEAQT